MYCQPKHGGDDNSPAPVYAIKGRATTCPGFDYFFPDADVQVADPARLAALDALGLEMIEQDPDLGGDSRLPAVMTYFGQFIDHDITAGTDRDPTGTKIDDPDLEPRRRDDVRETMWNMRSGRLDLDSLYGELPAGIPLEQADQVFLEKLRTAMRSVTFPGQMRIDFYDDKTVPAGVPLPTDRAGDLLRLGALMAGASPLISEKEIEGLSPSLRKMFTSKKPGGKPNIHRAVIGDARNDENLFVAQFHLIFLRLHNKLVQNRPKEVSEAEAFEWARQRTRWIYQWLVVNSYLEALCLPHILRPILVDAAPRYRAFLQKSGCPSDMLPLPLEFSVAAFRFGHSMVRDAYDWNTFFGTATTHPSIIQNASLALLFDFTGGGEMRGNADRKLPGNWGADWHRLIFGASGTTPSEVTRRIDTHLAIELGNLPDGQATSIIAHLARRNLRRDHMLNLPSAQDCAAGFGLSPLAGDALGPLVKDGPLSEKTPLWYYVLREAEVTDGWDGLGPLGSSIVAETLVGLLVGDDTSYWHQRGTDAQGRWHPGDLVIDGLPDLSSLEKVVRFTGLL